MKYKNKGLSIKEGPLLRKGDYYGTFNYNNKRRSND